MNQQEMRLEPLPDIGENDPPPDFSREEAAYEKERELLVREHLGGIALVRGDEVVGAFATAGDAMREGFRRFGYVQMMLKEIRATDEPDFMPLADITHLKVIRWHRPSDGKTQSGP